MAAAVDRPGLDGRPGRSPRVGQAQDDEKQRGEEAEEKQPLP